MAKDILPTNGWFVIDAKYSKLSSVRRHQTAALVFKYLVALKPMTEKDRLCGLLLFCGSIEPDAAPEGSIFDRLPPDAVGEPDLRLFRLNALDQSGPGLLQKNGDHTASSREG